jgi:hypothetical protein
LGFKILERDPEMIKKIAALVVAPIAAIGMVISLTGLTSANATLEGSNATGSSVGTVPQCAWHLDGVSTDVTLTHSDATKYKGLDYLISGSSNSVDSYVAPVAATSKPGSPGDDDCSWYTSRASASVTISTAADPGFTSSSFSGDTSMNFALTDSSHKLTATVSPSCASPWTTPAAGANDIYSGHVSAVATSLAKDDTTTKSACSYTVEYAATVPGGKAPAHAGSNYAMTGPTLTTTLVTSTS